MDFEFNPFRLLIPPGGEPIRSIQITSNLDWLNVPGPITGQQATMPLSAKTDLLALKVFGTPVGGGTPSMLSLVPGHIPQLEISKINGLQAALNSLVKTITSGNPTALAITNNGVGDYLVTPNFGQIANKFAQGNDNRFPSSVTGLRKGHGAGSTDTAAIPRQDYWDRTVFIKSGDPVSDPDVTAPDRRGLVPDPGPVSGTTRFLNEDGTWKTAGAGSVSSVGLTMPVATFSVSNTPITGSGVIGVDWNPVAAKKFLAGGIGTAIDAPPTFRFIDYTDINGLVGQVASTIAAGDDDRFSADVGGFFVGGSLRKSFGAGSTDVAAVRYTDYWDNTVFVSKGPSHKIGLVPDPGTGSAPYTRFLREDSTWQDIAGIGGGTSSTAPHTLQGNPTGSSAPAMDVSAKDARSGLLLNLESITTFGNANYTALATDKYVATAAAFSTDRTVTLPLANTFNPGQVITISDDFGAVGPLGILKIARQGSDTIQGSSAALTMPTTRGSYVLASDSVNKWSVISRSPSVVRRSFNADATYTTPTGAKALFVQVVGGGGGGGGAVASFSNASAGGGGGAGGYSESMILVPASSYAMAVGAAGLGGASGSTGGTGGTTSFGSVAVAQGGNGGGTMTGGNTPAYALPGIGGTSSGGTLNLSGSEGGHGQRQSGLVALSGFGAAAMLYSKSVSGLTVSQSNGNTTTVDYGSGGGGALSYSATGFTGGNGSQGIIIITEYY